MSEEEVRIQNFASLFVGRASDYARQHNDGHYLRVGKSLTYEVLLRHLRGDETVGSYVINEQGYCRYACFDADTADGLQTLLGIQAKLTVKGIVSYLEISRRGGHLWVFLVHPMLASCLRRWLLPFCPEGVEFYPKQDESKGYGSLMRLPLGVHRKSGKRYPFVAQTDGQVSPVARSLGDQLLFLTEVKRNMLPVVVPDVQPVKKVRRVIVPVRMGTSTGRYRDIPDCCRDLDPFALIGRYVDLDRCGLGCCPFGEHHSDGHDASPSFCVYMPKRPGDWCWYCYAWGRGGNQFNFLAMYYHLSGADLWQRIQAGGQF